MKSSNDYLKVEIKVEESKWNILEEDLFSVVIRKNKKRHFLCLFESYFRVYLNYIIYIFKIKFLNVII